MKPYYQDNHNTIYCVDFRKNELPNESVQCVVTSPPYWGLRKYSGEQELVWGGDPNCGHEETTPSPLPSVPKAGNKQRDYIEDGRYIGKHRWQHDGAEHDNLRFRGENSIVGNEKNPDIHTGKKTASSFCSLCGAWKGAYGLEPTPEMYAQHTIEILREIRRVLRKDGVVFWNIGDSYAGSGGANENKERGGVRDNPNRKPQSAITGMEPVTWSENGKPKKKGMTRVGAVVGLKPKDLCLIPFRIAIAAQEDGWWVRSVIIWSKPNPMPESVTDRPTESHEYILMLTKSARYYWDADAVREKNADPDRTNFVSGSRLHGDNPNRNDNDLGERSKAFEASGRNIRTVWEFPTQPYPEAHFAVFPEKLPELCIKAATPEVGCCSKCGAPWARVIESKQYPRHETEARDLAVNRNGAQRGKHAQPTESTTLGWRPTCKCNADKVPSLVLDCFMGAGTSLWVAKKLNRRAVGYELSEEYCQLTVERVRQQVLL